MRDWSIAEGREFVAEENDRAATVVLLGASVREKLLADADLSTLLLHIAFSGAVGVFFGFYPARMAVRLDPIAALRYE